MAITFGLDVEFGAAPLSTAAGALVRATATLPLARLELPLRTDVTAGGSLHVHPVGLSSAAVGALDLAGVTDADLTDLADALYQLLRLMDGYRAAVVRWSGGEEVLAPLLGGAPAADDLPGPHDTGLVLADDLVEAYRLDGLFVPFAPGHRWIPHNGFRLPDWLRA